MKRTTNKLLLLALVAANACSGEMPEPTPPPSRPWSSATLAEEKAAIDALQNDRAIVNVVVDNSYPIAEVEKVGALIDALPVRETRVTTGDSLSALIPREYGFGRSDLPAHYEELESQIVALNELPNADSLKAGKIAIPVLPRWGFARHSAPAALNVDITRFFKLDSGIPLGVVAAAAGRPVQPATTILTMRMTMANLTWSSLTLPDAIVTRPIPIFLAATSTGPSAATSVLSATEHAELRTRLIPGRRDIPLFVLDAGWPDEPTWRASREYLERLCSAVRKRFGFPPIPGSLRAAGAFPKPANADRNRAHAVGIQRAMADLVGLSPRVQVIYVPVTMDQNARDVISEIITLGQAIRLGLSARKGARTPLSVAMASGTLQAVQRYLPDVLAQVSPVPEPSGRADISSALVEGLLWIASEAAELDESVAVVNASWTTPAELAGVVLPPLGRVAIFAAVGNRRGTNVHKTPIVSLAGNSIDSNSIFAVMTLKANGEPDCDSSEVAYGNPLLGAAGFGGALSDGWCGSSFATPRVAWFAAARETIRPAAVSDARAWVADVKVAIASALAGPPPKGLLFRPLSYIHP